MALDSFEGAITMIEQATRHPGRTAVILLAYLLLLFSLASSPIVPAMATGFLEALDTCAAEPAPDDPFGFGAGNSNGTESETGTVSVNNGYTLNVRTGPWGKIIGHLKDGAKVSIKGKKGDWYKIEFDGKIAFVHSDYMKKNKDKAETASAGGNSSGGGSQGNDNSQSGDKPAGSNAKFAEGAPGSKAALNWATGGAKTYTNPNNGKKGPTAWTGYCLAHVNRCWSVGAGKPVADLQKCCAKQSYNAFKSHGKIKSVPKKGPIPAGAPVFWAGLSKWGHITISTGRVDKNGVPTVIDNHGGLYEVPITKYGTPSGWGVISGTPLT